MVMVGSPAGPSVAGDASLVFAGPNSNVAVGVSQLGAPAAVALAPSVGIPNVADALKAQAEANVLIAEALAIEEDRINVERQLIELNQPHIAALQTVVELGAVVDLPPNIFNNLVDRKGVTPAAPTSSTSAAKPTHLTVSDIVLKNLSSESDIYHAIS